MQKVLAIIFLGVLLSACALPHRRKEMAKADYGAYPSELKEL